MKFIRFSSQMLTIASINSFPEYTRSFTMFQVEAINIFNIFSPITDVWLDERVCCKLFVTCIFCLKTFDWWNWCKHHYISVTLLAQMIKKRDQSCKSANRSRSYGPSELKGRGYFLKVHYAKAERSNVPECVRRSSIIIQKTTILRHVHQVQSFLSFNT